MAEESKSSGVSELIHRLREEGVTDGQNRGEELFEQAKRRAEQRLEEARKEADELIQKAREEAQQTRSAGEDAVRLAVRDAVLTLKSELVEQFADRVRRLVATTLENDGFLQQLILEVAGRSTPEDNSRMQLLLPKEVVGLEQLRREPEEVKEGSLSHFVLSLTGEMLREGVEVGGRNHDGDAGIRIQLLDDDVEIDLTDQAIATLLLRHLQPRFRAMMEGIVQ